MDPEMASFVIKFQHLCRAGKDASLSLTSKTGKVSVNLTVELGENQNQPPFPQTFIPRRHRNGPSQVRRRNKRAEARKTFAEKASEEVSTEEADILNPAQVAEEGNSSGRVLEDADVLKEVTDAICPDTAYIEEALDQADAEKLPVIN